jgi:hypothetical protein
MYNSKTVSSNSERTFFVANNFQIQPFHKGLAMQADVAFKSVHL